MPKSNKLTYKKLSYHRLYEETESVNEYYFKQSQNKATNSNRYDNNYCLKFSSIEFFLNPLNDYHSRLLINWVKLRINSAFFKP